jgi:hypothetical protein
MTAETEAQGSGLSLDLEGRTHAIEFMSADDRERVTALLAERQQMRVKIDPMEDADTEGHVLATKALVSLRVLDGEDDTEGHAIAVHFPTAGDARDFRNKLVMTGAIVGTVTLAGLGVGAGLSQIPNVGAPSGGSGTEVSDSWSRMGVPGTAAGAAAEANAQIDGWQSSGVAGTGAAANAAANQETDSWQRMQVPGTGAVNPDELTDSWQRTGAPGTGAAENADADELTDSWQRTGVPGTGAADDSEDKTNR